MEKFARLISLASRAIVLFVVALVFIVSWPVASRSEGSADTIEINLLTAPREIPETNLVIDVPMSWSDVPPEVIALYENNGWFGDEIESEDNLAAFENATSVEGGTSIMLISRAGPLNRGPLEEMMLIEDGVKLSRLMTWIVGAGMEIVRPSRTMDIDIATGATLSFLSGQADRHDVITLSLIVSDDDTLLIVDLASKGSDDVLVLDEMRASIRPQ